MFGARIGHGMVLAFSLAVGGSGFLGGAKAFGQPASPVALSANVNWTSTYAILSDGRVKVWEYAQFTPKDVPGFSGLPGVRQITAGGNFALGVLADGTVKAWGVNNQGQLGFGDFIDRPNATPIPGLSGVKQVAAGYAFSLALLEDGTVKAWGNNDYGNLGLGDVAPRNTPTLVPGLTNVAQVFAQDNQSFALLSDGTVKAWGANFSGVLGQGDEVERHTPTLIPGLSGVSSLALGRGHALALLTNGTAKAWGDNFNGQLGLGVGSGLEKPSPTLIPGLSGVAQLVAGYNESFARMADGSVKAWGWNYAGQLALGDTTDRFTPVPIPGLKQVVTLAASFARVHAVLTDGSVRGWGILDKVRPEYFPAKSPVPVPLFPVSSLNDRAIGAGSNQFEYTGSGWTSGPETGAFNGDISTSGTANDFVSFRYRGTQVLLFAKTSAAAGIAAVSIDGGAETLVDLYSAAPSEQSLVYTSPYLAYANHTLKIRVTGTKNGAATGFTVSPDRVDVVYGPTLVNDRTTGTNSNQFDYQGSWIASVETGPYQNDMTRSNTSNDYLQVRFFGRKLQYFGKTLNNRGIAAFSIDGGAETLIDCYSAVETFQKLLYTSPVLPLGNHTLKVRVTGTKQSASSGFNVPADKVEIYENAPPEIAEVTSSNDYFHIDLHATVTDDGGEGELIYTWETVGTPPSPVNFTVNGTNAAKNTSMSVSKVGTYRFLLTVRDAQGLETRFNVENTVLPFVTENTPFWLEPRNPVVAFNQSIQFRTFVRDQFGDTSEVFGARFSDQEDAFGTLSQTGLFTAKDQAGTFQVFAEFLSGELGAATSVTIIASPGNPVWSYEGPKTFDGISTSVDGGTAAGSASNLTVAFYALADGVKNQIPVDKEPASGSKGWTVKLRADGSVWFRIGSNASFTDARTATGKYRPGAKVHVACTFSGGTAKVYINGVLEKTVTGVTQTVNETATHLRLGIPSVVSATEKFAGELQAVRVFDKALTAVQIQSLMTPLSGPTPVFVHVGPTDFNGTSTFVDGGASPGSSANLTVAFFATPDMLKNQVPVDKHPASGTKGWTVKLRSDGSIWFRIGSSAAFSDVRSAAGAYAAGSGVHVACTFGGGTGKLYLNGVLVKTVTGITTTTDETATPLRLGIPAVVATSEKFAGFLSKVKVYDQVLTDAQISAVAGGN